ncbi:RNaseH domain-containing protein [Cryptosporangium sp. NPDC051539]|uniref:RNaseH domain-containing protein n=1 Tax=Cryptosporangium sp. NPDC051539 TaxID=3363962 RepID=UPI0037940411
MAGVRRHRRHLIPSGAHVTTGPDELTLLAYPLTTELAGEVWIYDFPEKVRDAWDEAREDFYAATGSDANLPYAGLATALRAVGKTSLNFDPTSKTAPPHRMISRVPLKAADLHDAITVWNQVVLRIPDTDIRFSFVSKLADLISAVRPRKSRLIEHVVHHGSQPDAPDWVYSAATWEIAQRIARTSWTIDGKTISLRADTDGNLIAWDPQLLWEGRWKADDPPSYAALRVVLTMQTFPWIRRPVVVVEPQASRLTRWANAAGNAWLAPNDPTAPLLAIGLEKSAVEYSSRVALRVFSQLRAQPAPIVASEFDLTDPNSPVRALVPKSVRFPVGRGVGMHLVRELSGHFTTALDTPPVTAHNVAGHQFSNAARRTLDQGRDTELLHPDELPAIIAAAGCQNLRILALYRNEHTRGRIQRLLAYHFARPDLADQGIGAGQPVRLAERVEVIMQPAADLLDHGDHDKRRALVDELVGLDAPVGTRVVAMCETDYDEAEWAKLRKLARRKDSAVVSPDLTDAKPEVNRLLAEQGVAAQFLATAPNPVESDSVGRADDSAADGATTDDDVTDPLAPAPGLPEQAEPDPLSVLGTQLKRDHAGHNALADMLRVAGLVHPRLGRALAYGQWGTTEPLAYVGLNVREQRGQLRKFGKPRLSWSLVAIIPDRGYWRVKAFAAKAHPTEGHSGWVDYTDANVAFRANGLPEGRRKDSELVAAIDVALDQLRGHLPAPVAGYVLFVSGENARTLWPRLANKNLEQKPDASGLIDGRPPLPGMGWKTAHRPRAVVRVTSASSGIPRPVQVSRTTIVDGVSVESVTKTTRALYQLDGGTGTWILANVPRQFDGSSVHSRAGSKYTRWSAQGAEQRKTWYSHTTTEIYVAHCEGDPLRYAVLAARLCHHALSWEGRTRYPAPVHLAIQMDKDHPEYRRTVDASDEVDPEETADADAATPRS